MFIKEYTYSYKDIALVPSIQTRVEHRADCNPYISYPVKKSETVYRLPIFVAPMSSIVNQTNFSVFSENAMIPILPRSENFETRFLYALNSFWAAFSLSEAESLLTNKELKEEIVKTNNIKTGKPFRLLIDVANGHMKSVFSLCRTLKDEFGRTNIEIMMGNIANPETYELCCECDIDYVRCSIGTGDGCTTSTKTGIHYGIASLIDDIVKIKSLHKFRKCTKIIADGGIRGYDDVIKAIALGADFVMIGGLFGTCKESCGDKYIYRKDGSELLMTESERQKWLFESNVDFNLNDEVCDVYTHFYGMASNDGQKAISGKAIKAPEGISKRKKVTTSIREWTSNMVASLKSAMSYSNAFNIKEFQENSIVRLVSPNTYNSVNRF